MQKLVIFGKGGIGKSTVTSNLAVTYARSGRRVLVVGCDPKHDTTVSITGGRMIPTVVAASAFRDGRAGADEIVVRGRLGIDCVEAGGPEPGVGCAGRGISRMAEILEEKGILDPARYDVVLFDVLGDVVCGGFAAPLRQGFAEKVVIVTSEESMSLYAANNICRAVRTYLSNGVALLGLIANLRSAREQDARAVERFAELVATRVLARLPREGRLFRQAERQNATVCDVSPHSAAARRFAALAEALLELEASRAAAPRPLSDEEFFAASRADFDWSADDFARRSAAAAAETVEPAPGARGERVRAQAPDRAADEPDLAAGLEAALQDGGACRGLPADGRDGDDYQREALGEETNAGQWGSSKGWRKFFADMEFEHNRDVDVRFSGPIQWIFHGDMECRYSVPSFDEGLVSFWNLPCLPPYGERRKHRAMGGYDETNLQESDVIAGGLEALESALRRAESKGVEMAVINSTCVPLLIGDDSRMLAERSRARSGMDVFHNSPSSGKNLNMAKAMLDRLRADPRFSAVRPEPRTVNLIGFPPGAGTEELKSLLAEAGVRVNACYLPYFDYDEARLWRRASVHILYPAPERKALYDSLLAGEDIPASPIAPPYGMVGTRRWLREVCRLAGAAEADADAAFEKALSHSAAEWNEARARVRGRRLGFVLDARRLRRLLDERGVAGVPLFDVLQEGGFGLDFLLYRPGGRPGPCADARVKTFEDPSSLAAALACGRFDAVYSEYFFDERLSAAGKAQFSLAAFSMGAAGAARTLRRLADLCEWRFPRRYAPGGEVRNGA